eukprot:Hpha_TRINITY_DN9150_c0_g1::TRINITY_DN9150_c0_g1_i1::g.94301::m.94301
MTEGAPLRLADEWGVSHFNNPGALPSPTPYPPHLPVTLEGHHRAREEIEKLPGYVPTPLVAASEGLVRRCNVGSVWLKDETNRLGMTAFKALGGFHAVRRVLEAEG